MWFLMIYTLGLRLKGLKRRLRRMLTDPAVRRAGLMLGQAGLGFLSSAGSLVHTPLPLSLSLVCAGEGASAFCLSLGALAGYAFFWGEAAEMCRVWILLGLAASLCLSRTRYRGSLLMAAMCSLIVAATGLLFQLGGSAVLPTALHLMQVTLSFIVCAMLLSYQERGDPLLGWGLLFFGVLSLAQVAPWIWLDLGMAAGAALACAGAMPAAVLAGLALDLAQITPVSMTGTLLLAYLLRLLPGKRRLYLLGPCLCYAGVMMLLGVWDLAPLPALAVGSAVSLLLPGKISPYRRRGETGVAQVRLEMAAGVMERTRDILSMEPDTPIDEEAIVDRAYERACTGCPARKGCRGATERPDITILHKPLGDGSEWLLQCRKSSRLLAELRRSQESYRTIRADRDRREEYRRALMEQYGFLGRFLHTCADGIARRKDPIQRVFTPEVAFRAAGKEPVSGDRGCAFAGTECKYYILLCDGMGTGEEAAQEGKRAGKMLRQLLSAGFPAEDALRSVNDLCVLRGQAGAVTMDLAEVNLDTGQAAIYKWGAAASYLVSGGETIKIGTVTPPPGLAVARGRVPVEKLSLRRGETLILLSDGVSGEGMLSRIWAHSGKSAQKLAAEILDLGNADGGDDATVAVVRLHPASVPVS